MKSSIKIVIQHLSGRDNYVKGGQEYYKHPNTHLAVVKS